jgi:hypothetical protein
MADFPLGEVAGGSALVLAVAKLWWDDREKRRATLEAKAETSEANVERNRDDKLELVLAKLTALELELRTLVEKLSAQTGAVAEVKARVEGISSNHGSRIGTIEQTLVEHRTRIVGLEDRPARGRK